MTQIELTNEVKVELVDYMGNDLRVVNAARVSLNQHSDVMAEKDAGLINFLMKNRHSSPFEHVTATFMIECPIFVTREVHRHRTFSYNEVSGRYSVLKPKFYAPDYDRPLVQVGKPGAYTFEKGSNDAYINLYQEHRFAYQTAWNAYEYLLEEGIAKEVARNCLPVGLFTSFYMTGSLRNWMGFLSLRTADDALFEIRNLAFQIEELLYEIAPISMKAWNENGRVSI